MSKEEQEFADSDLEKLTKEVNDRCQSEIESQKNDDREIEVEKDPPPEEVPLEQEPQLDNYAPDLQSQAHSYPVEQTLQESRKRNQPSKVKRENARLVEAVNLLAEENARLKEETNYAVKVALENAQKELEQQAYMAELALTQAVENGDAQSIGQATRKIAELATERSKHETYAKTPIYEDTKPQYIEQSPNPLDILDDIQDLPYGQFLERNPYADPRSPNYIPSLASEIDSAAEMLDKHLATTGQQHLISSDAYFAEIEGYIRNKYTPKQEPQILPTQVAQKPQPQNNTSYKASVRPGVGAGGTGGFYETNVGNNKTGAIRLTPSEEEIALRGVGETKEEKIANYLYEKQRLTNRR